MVRSSTREVPVVEAEAEAGGRGREITRAGPREGKRTRAWPPERRERVKPHMPQQAVADCRGGGVGQGKRQDSVRTTPAACAESPMCFSLINPENEMSSAFLRPSPE